MLQARSHSSTSPEKPASQRSPAAPWTSRIVRARFSGTRAIPASVPRGDREKEMAFRECRIGMAVGPHPRTAEAGLEALRAGGNAFDAAVTAAFTEAVVQPAHNGVAGYGGGAVLYDAKLGLVTALDFNSEAPAAA